MPLTMNRPSVSVQLKERTREAHVESENLLLPVLASIQTIDQYAALLNMFYGFYQPLEQEIDLLVDKNILPDIEERRKSSLILDDLASVGRAGNAMAMPAQLPLVQSLPDALGALYVLEGSTLGGRMIAKMLAAQTSLSLQPNHLHFFNGYGEATASRWKSFQQMINHYIADVEQIVISAQNTFKCMSSWIRHSFPHESTN